MTVSTVADLNGEQGTLSCVILSEDGHQAGEMLSRLEPDHFYDVRNREVLGMLKSLPTDLNGTWRLKMVRAARKLPKPVSDVFFDLQQAGATPLNFDYHFEDLEEAVFRRQATEGAEELIRVARDPKFTVEEIESARLNLAFTECKSGASNSLSALLDCQFNPDNPPLEIQPVYFIGDAVICTPGNITVISAQAKAGKSAFLCAMLSATMTPPDSSADNFGIKAVAGKGVILHFDTEQSKEDHDMVMRSALKRAGVETVGSIRSFCLKGRSSAQCLNSIRMACRYFAKDTGYLHSVFIDGVADLVEDVNQQDQCNPLVTELEALAVKYQCPVICVIHTNPNAQKTRGHLGSQLERKAESNLQLEKDGDSTVVFSTKSRRAPICKDTGPRFAWSDEHGMHRSIEPLAVRKKREAEESSNEEVSAVFGEDTVLVYSEMKSRAMEMLSIKSSTFDTRKNKWQKANRIGPAGYGKWEKL